MRFRACALGVPLSVLGRGRSGSGASTLFQTCDRGRRGYTRLAMVHRRALRGITPRHALVLHLHRRRRRMPLTLGEPFLSGGLRRDSTLAAIEADTGSRIRIGRNLVKRIVDDRHIDVVDRCVVEECAVVPIATDIADARSVGTSRSVVDTPIAIRINKSHRTNRELRRVTGVFIFNLCESGRPLRIIELRSARMMLLTIGSGLIRL